MNPTILLLTSLLGLLPITTAFGGYSQEQLEVYDLYDELRHTTFYKFLKEDLPKTATKKEIKSAYKKKALIWHPDKVEEGTDGMSKKQIEHRFRQLSQVKDILTDPELKETYDDVLKNGLPPGMSFRYFRAVMKMSVKQVLIFVFLCVWLIHYLCLWGRYFEKQLIVADQSKRSKRKAKEMASLVIAKPSFWDTLPCLIWHLCVYLVTVLPGEIKQRKIDAENRRVLEVERIAAEKLADEEAEKLREQREKQKQINKVKHQEWVAEQQRLAAERYNEALAKAQAAQAEDDDEYAALDGEWDSNDEDVPSSKRKNNKKKNRKKNTAAEEEAPKNTGPWTDEERTKMVELMNKWPGGTPDRWLRIAEALNRKESDVVKQLKTIKQSSISTLKTITIDKKDKSHVGTDGNVKAGDEEASDDWTKSQQQALEKALKVFTKDYEGDRWLEISKCVEGRSKKDCVLRYKAIAAKLRSIKENAGK